MASYFYELIGRLVVRLAWWRFGRQLQLLQLAESHRLMEADGQFGYGDGVNDERLPRLQVAPSPVTVEDG